MHCLYNIFTRILFLNYIFSITWFVDPENKTSCRFIVVDSYNEHGPLRYYSKNDFITYRLVLEQKQNDKNRIYSLHETEVACIAKGKKHKPYEFDSKVFFAVVPGSNIIVGVQNYAGNPHDITTL